MWFFWVYLWVCLSLFVYIYISGEWWKAAAPQGWPRGPTRMTTNRRKQVNIMAALWVVSPFLSLTCTQNLPPVPPTICFLPLILTVTILERMIPSAALYAHCISWNILFPQTLAMSFMTGTIARYVTYRSYISLREAAIYGCGLLCDNQWFILCGVLQVCLNKVILIVQARWCHLLYSDISSPPYRTNHKRAL